MDEMITYCAKKDIQLVFVTPPTYKEYHNRLNEVQRDRMNHVLDSLTASNSNVSRIDYLRNESYDQKDFLDGDHLNTQGALKFTTQLNNLLKDL